MSDVAALGGASTIRAPRHLVIHYLVDLLVSACLVLIAGWLFEVCAGNHLLRPAVAGESELYTALSRFTPHHLAVSYAQTIDPMTRDLLRDYNATGVATATQHSFAAAAFLVADLTLAVPRTLIRLFGETRGLASWIVLAGVGMAAAVLVIWLRAAWLSPARLAIALVLSPFAISVAITMLQAFMALMLAGFYWLTLLAPYTVACPVLCSAWWVCFPNAEAGATITLARALARRLPAGRQYD